MRRHSPGGWVGEMFVEILKQHLPGQFFVIFLFPGLVLPACRTAAFVPFRVPVEHDEVGVRLPLLDSAPQVRVGFRYVLQATQGIRRKEIAYPERMAILPGLVYPEVSLRNIQVMVPDIQPDVFVLPVVYRENDIVAGYAFPAQIQHGHILQTLYALCCSYTGQHNTILGYPRQEGLIVLLADARKVRALHDGEGRGLSHPHVFFARFPCYPAFRILQLVETRNLLQRQAIPSEFRTTGHEKLLAPLHHGLDAAVVNGLFVDKNQRQLLGVNLSLADELVHKICHAY